VRDDFKITRDLSSSIAGMICFHMSAITGETTLLKSVRSRAIVLHDDSFVERLMNKSWKYMTCLFLHTPTSNIVSVYYNL
jgi:hypothetical protein